MTAKYIFRLDDIAENMHWNNFNKMKDVFIKYNVQPLIGVIPKNSDPELLKYPSQRIDFWEEIRALQIEYNWSIALHGYNHVYETKDSGLLGINKRSEFAGLPKDTQNEKIVKGKKIFEKNKIEIDAFMAPAHSFDKTTIECLKENNINTVTDGYGLYPYYQNEILFVPQLFSRPRKVMIGGIYTWCLHLNTMSEKSIANTIEFIENNHENIISFKEAKNYVKNSKINKAQRILLKWSLKMLRNIK